MDPALRELLRSGADAELEEVEAIMRLDRPHVDVAGVRIVARFGPVVTCRLWPDLILATWHDDNVASLKCSRPLGPEPAVDVGARGGGSPPARDERRAPAVTPTGAGVVVGVVDWGCDFDHPNLKHPDGTTRLLGLWDQRGPANDRSPQPYGYGTFHDRQRINAALGTSQPYDALGYHPAAADRDGRGAHGTHVMDIAAGNGLAGGPVGVAPGADPVFVHLAERGARGLANLGDSARILEAVDFIGRVAGRRPWVINLSVGRCGGPHDGTTLAELALDHLVAVAPGRFIVQSAGNYFDRHTHATGRVEPGGSRTLTFVTDPADLTPNELEVWYPGGDELTTLLESPRGIATPWIALDEEGDVVDGGSVVGRIYHRRRDPNNGDHHIDLFLSPTAPAGVWNLTLQGVRVVRGGFDAWLERDEACGPCQARFVPDDVDRRTTTGTIANGRQPFVVGAYDGHSPTWTVAPFSSVGPTRDGRPKPDCVAPGVEVLAARSAPPGSARSPGLLTRKSGSSMAAPHVTGAVALCLEAARRPLASNEIRALLQRTLAPAPSGTPESPRLGGGYLDVGRLVAAATAITPRKELHMEANPDHVAPALIRPDALYRHVAYRRDEPLPASIDQSYVVVARPGEVPRMRPDRGDILVRVALGERGLAHVAVLSSPELVPWQALDAAGMPHEREGPGSYAPVVEDGPWPHPERFARRILDRYGCMPRGQLLLRPRAAEAEDAEATKRSDSARLEWVDLTTVTGGDGLPHLYYLTSGPPGGGPSKFRLRVTNTNAHVNLVEPVLKVRLRAQTPSSGWRPISLEGQGDDQEWKVIGNNKEVADESSEQLELFLDPRTRWKARDSDHPRRWLDLEYHWKEFGGSEWYTSTSLSFFLVDPVEFMLTRRRFVKREHLRDRATFAAHHQLLASNGQSTPVTFHVSGRTTVSDTRTGQVTLQTATTTTRATEAQQSQTQQQEFSVGIGIDEMFNLGQKYSSSVSSSLKWSESFARQLTASASRTESFTVGSERGIVLDGTIPAASPGRSVSLYAYPIVAVYDVPVVMFEAPNQLGQATRRRTATVPIAWVESWGTYDITEGGPEPVQESADAEEASSFCAQARTQARGSDTASTRLVDLLRLPIASDDFAGIQRRVQELTGLFRSLDPQQKTALRQRLNDPNDALGRFFDCELHRDTRRRLRALLQGPAPSPPPPPSPTANPCRRRDAGAITVLQPWERTLLALMNGVDESIFAGMTLITGPVLLPGIHGQLHRMLVPMVLAQPSILAITIGNEVWFKEPLDTSTSDGLKLLVHESVHVVDYDRMGIEAFLSSYVASGMVAGFRHGDIPHEERANAVEAVVPRLLQRFPDLNRLITSCDSDGILTELQTNRETYRQAINSLL